MIVLTVSVMILFWLRDYFLLQVGRRPGLALRAGCYAFAVFVMAALASGVVTGLKDSARFQNWLVAAIVCHALAGAGAAWMILRNHDSSAWTIALIPAPVVWTLLIASGATPPLLAVTALLWTVSAIHGAWRARGRMLPPDDVRLSVEFAAWINCAAVCLVPLLS